MTDQNQTTATGTEDAAGPQLLSIVERIEKIDEEISDLREGRKEILAEAKGSGFDKKAINEVIKRRKRDRDELEEAETMVTLYEEAIQRAGS